MNAHFCFSELYKVLLLNPGRYKKSKTYYLYIEKPLKYGCNTNNVCVTCSYVSELQINICQHFSNIV